MAEDIIAGLAASLSRGALSANEYLAAIESSVSLMLPVGHEGNVTHIRNAATVAEASQRSR